MTTEFITSKDALIYLTASTIFSSPFQVQGFQEGSMIRVDTEANQITQMGADGHLSIGAISSKSILTFSLAADSPTWEYLDAIYNMMTARAFAGMASTLVMTLPAHGKKVTYSRGAITKINPSYSDAGKYFNGGSFIFETVNGFVERI